MSHTRSPRSRALVVLLGFATLLLGVLVPAPAASAAVLTGGASLAHPFSEPVWWPVDTTTYMDCYRGNPGCRTPTIVHNVWMLDVVSTNRDVAGQTAWEPVHPMGAGIAHWGNYADTGCGGRNSRGNWLWIDHGNGTISWYGHLAWPFTVPDGAYVTPQSKIGYIGNSGFVNCRDGKKRTLHYLDIAVKRGGWNDSNSGDYVQLRHLYACRNGQRVSYPEYFSRNRYTYWNAVPQWISHQSTPLIPGSSRSCIANPPHTPDKATVVHLRRAGSGTLRATWVRPVTGYPRTGNTIALLQEYHPTIRRWTDRSKHVLSPNAWGTGFGGLTRGHSFRIRINFVNYAGVSANSTWVTAVAS